jgi:hypothetical protein
MTGVCRRTRLVAFGSCQIVIRIKIDVVMRDMPPAGNGTITAIFQTSLQHCFGSCGLDSSGSVRPDESAFSVEWNA